MHKLSIFPRFFHLKKCFLIPPGLCLLWFLFALPNRNLTFFPGTPPSKIEGFNDHETGGNSALEDYSVSKQGISIQYMLHDSLLYPYTGFKILLLDKDSLPLNLSSYDYLFLDITCRKQQSVDLFLHTTLPGYTIPSKPLTYRFLYKYLVFLDPHETRKIDLTSLETPGWWYYNNHLSKNSLGKEKFKRVAEIIIQSGNNNPINQSFGFTVHKLSVHRDIKKRALLAFAAIIVWFLFYFLVYLFYTKRKSNDKKVVVSYEPLSVSNQADDCFQRIIQCIAKEYTNPDLTVNTIAREVGVLPAKVTRILQNKKQCSYKQYLNAIRLKEAKRLLQETDRNITDIAYKVGYRNVTHFNRIFKQMEGISPRSYRSGNSP